jgi:hypothetical protein
MSKAAGDYIEPLRVTMGEGGVDQFEGQGFERAFEWPNRDGSVACWCERRRGGRGEDEYLYVFAGSAAFHITAGGVVNCFGHENSTPRMLRHLLLNQIVPRYLATRGRLLLHAGAVTLANGRSVAFLGRSGFGKSTLVASFHRHGARLISDDCILLENAGKGVTVVGGLAGFRLFPDSVTAVFEEHAGFTNYTPYTDKQQLFLQGEDGGGPSEGRVLDAMFLMNDPARDPACEVRIEPVSGPEAMMAMIDAAFSLDPSDKALIASNFRNAGQVIGEEMGVFALGYPRRHVLLKDVRAAVSAHVS